MPSRYASSFWVAYISHILYSATETVSHFWYFCTVRVGWPYELVGFKHSYATPVLNEASAELYRKVTTIPPLPDHEGKSLPRTLPCTIQEIY